jgi:hypothetical protein
VIWSTYGWFLASLCRWRLLRCSWCCERDIVGTQHYYQLVRSSCRN